MSVKHKPGAGPRGDRGLISYHRPIEGGRPLEPVALAAHPTRCDRCGIAHRPPPVAARASATTWDFECWCGRAFEYRLGLGPPLSAPAGGEPFELTMAEVRDRGCIVARSCLACPLSRCIEDMTGASRAR